MKKIINLFFIFSLTITLFGCKKKTKIYERDNKTLYFGSYPQSLVNDESIINSLNEKIGTIPSNDNLGKWKDYNYYIEGNIKSFMYYIDIDLDNDKVYDYRGVYFNSYRPFTTLAVSNTDESYQDDNNYFINNVYYFKYETIKWDILEENEENIFIVSNIIVDSQDYYPLLYSDEEEHNGGIGYANNYKLSNIRKWLNEYFYDTAFNSLEKEIINITEVDNSKETTTSPTTESYTCENTFDKLFLLSYTEGITYYKFNEDRMKKGSDYAKCQGLSVAPNGYSQWRLRSPYNYMKFDTLFDHYGKLFNRNIANTAYGIRPALWVEK